MGLLKRGREEGGEEGEEKEPGEENREEEAWSRRVGGGRTERRRAAFPTPQAPVPSPRCFYEPSSETGWSNLLTHHLGVKISGLAQL